MTGKELYNIYKQKHAERGCVCDDWEDIDKSEQDVWCAVATELLLGE